MRLVDADALAHDLEYDVELCAKALDDMNLVGKEREDMQFQKDCKQNCIWYISEQPTVDAVPVKHGKWIKLDMHAHLADHKCTACGQECYVPTCMGEPMYIYCPNCGARMDEE